jgi:DNA-binding response OmpR family regulator
MPAMNPARLLLLEDDAVSRAFLCEALAPLRLPIDVAITCAQARALAGPAQALWLFDAHVPDGDAQTLLADLRARGLRTPALALTAEDTPVLHRTLLASGFVRVLDKPIDGTTLRAAVAAELAAHAPAPMWDDARALPALAGRHESLQALRALFLRELPLQLEVVAKALAGGDHEAARAELHRLKAGCGFVGAAGLLQAATALHAQPSDQPALQRLLQLGDRHLEQD